MNELGLGEFIDRDTFLIVREYPHPIERLWDALTDSDQLISVALALPAPVRPRRR